MALDSAQSARLEKFKRVAGMVASPQHLKKIMDSFPEEDRPAVMEAVKDKLQVELSQE